MGLEWELQPQDLQTLESNSYRLERTATGFLIGGRADRHRVHVELQEASWMASAEDPSVEAEPFQCGLFEMHRLVSAIARLCLADWRPRPSRVPQWKLLVWMQNKTQWAIAATIGNVRKELLEERIDPRILATQRANFATCHRTTELYLHPEFYRAADPHLLKDIQKYRAAAIAVNDLGPQLLEHTIEAQFGVRIPFNQIWITDDMIRSVTERLHNWRALFSNTGRSYPALNRTLDALPGRVAPSLVCQLRRIHLPRAYLDRVELLVMLLSHEVQDHPHHRIFEFASRREIKSALRIVADELWRPLSLGKLADLSTFVRYLCDYPFDHRGKITGLAQECLRFHRHLLMEDLASRHEDVDTPVQAPPVPLPEVPGLRFLDKPSEIREEGRLMGHCIGHYVSRAKAGQSFLFHYEYRGEMASIELDPAGVVKQSMGPHNRPNGASRRGARILAAWGSSFPRQESRNFFDDEVPF